MAELEAIVQAKAELIGMSTGITFGTSMDCAIPHVEIDAFGYHLVVRDRGKESSRKTTTDLDEFLYWFFKSETFGMAIMYQLEHREKGRDSRRTIHRKQLGLLGRLDANWRERCQKDIEEQLALNPYVDTVE